MLKEVLKVKGTLKLSIIRMAATLVFIVIDAFLTFWIADCVNAVATDMPTATRYLMLIFMALIIEVFVEYLNTKIIKKIFHKTYTYLNNKVAIKIANADYKVFVKWSSGQISTIVNQLNVTAHFGDRVATIFRSLAQFVVTSVSICMVEKMLFFPIIILNGIGVLVLSRIFKKLEEADVKKEEYKHARNDEVNKIIYGFAEVRANNTQQYHIDKIEELNNKCYNQFMLKLRYVIIENTTLQLLDSLLCVMAIMYSMIAIPQGLATSTAMSLVIFAWRLMTPCINLTVTLDEFSEDKAIFKKYKEFIDIEPEVIDGEIELKDFNNSIKLEHVSFEYESSDSVLDDVSFTIKKGEKIGICGCSGGGKSTLLKLIPRMYDVTDGSISIDGIDIRKFTQNSLRKHMGIVHQNNYIFKGSILDNVTYGTNSVTMSQVIEVCKKACIYDFIDSLPDRFNTDVGPNGLKLSGGQQQRIALARIFLNNPDIIILDEATSALDNEAEAIIQDSLKMFKDKTMITVAHRLSTIQDSDRILVIDEHKVVEEGTHEELMEKKGIYYKLHHAKD